jgi:DNA-binding protein HU-beta
MFWGLASLGGKRESVEKFSKTTASRPMASKPATPAKRATAPKVAAKKPGKPVIAAVKKPAAKTARAAAPKKAAETVTLKTVFEQLAEAHDLPKKQAQSLLTGFVASVTGILKNGDRVRMSGLGIIEVKDRPARMGRNPATGAAVQIAASKKVAFRAAKELNEAV